MSGDQNYVSTDAHGVMRVGNSRVMLDSVLAAFQQGHSPESIRNQYPSLTLEEVYGAITFYLAHQDEIHDYLRRQDQVWEQWRGRTDLPNPLIERLRSTQKLRTG